MENFWRHTGIALGTHWKIVTAVMVVLTAVLAIGATRIEFATGQDSYLNPDSQIAIDNVTFQDDFGGETIILLFNSEGDATVTDLVEGDNLAELERLNAELAEIDEVFSVVTPLTSLSYSAEIIGGELDAASGALTAALSREESEAGAAERTADLQLSLARRTAAGPEEERIIGNPLWNQVLLFDNTGWTTDEDRELVPPPEDELVVRESLRGTFPNTDGVTQAGTAVGGIVLDGNATLDELTVGTDKALEILDTAEFDGFELTVTGSPIYLGEINDYLKGGMATLGAAALVVMAVILALIFKVRWRLLPLLAVIVGVIWAFSLLGLIGIDLSLVTISGLPILIGLGIDFAIQIHNRVEEEVVLDKDEHPIAETVSNVAPPLIAAVVTGILAFLALRISKVPMIRDFGVLLAIGVVVLVVVGIVVPVTALGVREWTSRTDERGESAVEKLVVKLGGLPTKLGVPIIVIATVLFVGGILVEGRTKIQSDPVKWIDQGSQTVTDIDRLADDTGFASTLGVLVTANNVFDQQVVDMIWEFTEAAEARPEVVASSSLVGTMEKVINIGGETTPMPPRSQDVVNAATEARNEVPAVARALVNDDDTAVQVNLRLTQGSLEERAVLVDELAADLDARIDALDVPADSVLLDGLAEGQEPVKATPAGLATVGIGLLENLSANRANLTYLALALAGLFLVIRFRSLPRAVLALVPVLIAVGASSLFVGLLGFELSPLTTVSGPLVIATCAEFSVLILGRYLEERQNGLTPRESTDKAASRTGRAFFTSAMTTIGGFAVLIFSPLPLLRDFGIIVTLNVAIALLAALVAMPPLSVWVDQKGWLGTQEQGALPGRSVRMAAVVPGTQLIGAGIGVVALIAAVVGVYATADTDGGTVDEVAFAAVPLPTTTTTSTTTTTTVAPAEPAPDDTASEGEEPADDGPSAEVGGPAIDPSTFGTERPTSLVGGVLFDLLTSEAIGVEPNVAVCTVETLLVRITEDELLALGAAEASPDSVEFVEPAALDCGVTQNQVDRAVATLRGEPLPPVDEAAAPADGTDEPVGTDDAARPTAIDPSTFGTERPTSLVGGVLFDLLTSDDIGVEDNVAVCTTDTLLERITEDELLALGAAEASPDSVEFVEPAALDCGVTQNQVDRSVATLRGEELPPVEE